jgi:hypothetical protein
MDKIKFLAFVGFLTVLFASNVSAAWWNPLPRCDDVNIWGCCEDECWDGQLKCTPDGMHAYQCGDYDNLLTGDIDRCFEFPVIGATTNTITCPFGCYVRADDKGDICVTEDPCAGQGCIPGETRCGRKCPEGQSCVEPGSFTDASFLCKKINIGGVPFDCYGWGFDDPNAEECIYGCDWGSDEQPGGGKCLDQNQRDLSTCVSGVTKCDESGFYVIECIDENLDGTYHWQTNQLDWQSCPNGCGVDYEIDGMAYCKSEAGETVCDECLQGATRCNPNNRQYMQWCWDSDIKGCSRWTTDYSRFVEKFGFDWHTEYGQYCAFGCHLGKCRANPEPDVPELDTCGYVGQTRCGGDGSFEVFCEEDETGTLVWGNQKKCLSGRCTNGVCVTPTNRGFDEQTIGIPENLEILTNWAMSSDERFIYVNALVGTDAGLIHTLLTFDKNLTFVDFCFLNLSTATLAGSTVMNGEIWIPRNTTALVQIDRGCVNRSVLHLSDNVTSSARLTSNGTHFFINDINSSDGLGVFNSGGQFEGNICMLEPSNTACRRGQTDLVHLGDRIYVISPLLTSLIDEATVEIYGIDGYFFGNDTLTVPEGYDTDDLRGITTFGDNRLIILWTKLEQIQPGPAAEWQSRFLFSHYYLDRSCINTCHQGGSKCAGLAGKEYLVRCIQTPDGCWKYFDEVGHLFPAGTADEFMDNCGSAQCKETWDNHFILRAFCDDDNSCEDVCDLGEFGCDEPRIGQDILRNEGVEGAGPGVAERFTGSRYRVACTLKSSPVPFNLGRQCFGWADPFDATINSSLYEFCGQSHTCVAGECVLRPNECQLNESHCEIVAGRQYRIPCDTILNRNVWSWGNRTQCQWGCNETFNATTELRIGTCLTPTTGQTTVVGIKNAVAEFRSWWEILWPDPLSQLFIILLLSMGAFALMIPTDWRLGAGAAGSIFIVHLANGWLGAVFMFAILAILAIMVLPRFIQREDN